MKGNRLCLGTVQFGQLYGINNKTGQPSTNEVFNILDHAIANNITFFDTAPGYGKAENILGDYISSRNCSDAIKVISKLKFIPQQETHSNVQKLIEHEVMSSIERLKMEYLDGYLLHNAENIYNNNVLDCLLNIKTRSLIRNIGVSIYKPEDALHAVNSGVIDYIQIPFNIFDQRLINTEFFNIAKSKKITIFARSAFLQGLLLMDYEDVPEHLKSAKQYIIKLDKIVKRYQISRFNAAILFSYSNIDIDYVLFGVETLDQLLQITTSCESDDLPDDCVNELKEQFKYVDEFVVSPNMWGKASIIDKI